MTRTNFELLAEISSSMNSDRPGNSVWTGSPFEWILGTPSATKGKIGKELAAEWAKSVGILVASGSSTDADRIMNGALVQIRMSTLWDAGHYKFQQIRNLRYDYLFCLGLSPFQVHSWLIPKSVLLDNVIGRRGQHSGSESTDTSWISVTPKKQEPWLRPYGDSLTEVHRCLMQV